MGEIADMMLNGVLCAGCGEVLEPFDDSDEEPGYPIYCAHCQKDFEDGPDPVTAKPSKAPKKVACPDCGKRVKMAGLAMHRLAKHSE